jgi:hypothetical protein
MFEDEKIIFARVCAHSKTDDKFNSGQGWRQAGELLI